MQDETSESLGSPQAMERRSFPGRPYDLLPIGHLAATPEGVLLRVNPNLAAMLGYADEGELFRSSGGTVHFLWEESPDWEVLQATLQVRGSLERLPAVLRRRDGSGLPCALWVRKTHWPWAGADVVEVVVQSEAERHQALAALTQVLRLYRDMLDLNPDPVLIHRDSRILFANRAAEFFLGRPGLGSLVGRGIGSVLAPRSLAEVERHHRAVAGGAPCEAEFELTLAGGEVRWVRDFGTRITFQGQSAILTLLHDLTARRQAEEALARAELLYRTMAESAPVPMYIHAEGVIQYANPAAAAFVDAPGPAALLGRRLSDLFHPEALPVLQARIQQILASPGVSEAEYALQMRDGSHRQVLSRSTRTQYRGRPAILSVLLDQTRHLQLQQSLDEARQLYHTVLEHLPEAVCLHDGERILYANPRQRSLFAPAEAGDLVGRRVEDLIHPDSVPVYRQRLAEVRAGQSEAAEEYPVRYADGRVLHVAEKTVPVEVGGRSVFLAIVRDVSDRVEAEQARDEAVNLYRRIVENSPHPIAIYSPGELHYGNSALARFYRLDSVEQLMRTPLADLVDDETGVRLAARIQALFDSGESAETVGSLRLRSGEEVHHQVSIAPIQYQGRRRLLSLISDLTAYRRAEAERDQARSRYEALFQAAPVGIALASPERRFVRVNRYLAEMFGYPSPEAMAAEVQDIATGFFDDPEDYWRVRRRVEGEDRVWDYECLCRRRNGDRFWASHSLRVVRGADGGLEGFEAFVRDTTAHRRAEAERDLALQGHEHLFQAAPLGIAVYVPGEGYTRVNRRMAELFGYPSPEALVREVGDDIVRLYANEADHARLREITRGRSEVRDFEHLARRRDGSTFWVSRSVRIVPVPGREGAGYESFVRDITARRQAQVEAEENRRRVQVLAGDLAMASERERRSLARDLHDGPVQLLALSTLMVEDLARKHGQEREFALALSLLRDAAVQLRTVTDDLTPPALFADSLAGTLACLGRDFFSRYGMEVEVSCPDAPGLSRDGVAFICRAVRELLVNGVKHGRASRARVEVALRDSVLRLSAMDNGRGFDPAGLDALEPRSQGLPGLRSLCRDLGGTMVADSAPGRGTRVVLDLPLGILCNDQGLPG